MTVAMAAPVAAAAAAVHTDDVIVAEDGWNVPPWSSQLSIDSVGAASDAEDVLLGEALDAMDLDLDHVHDAVVVRNDGDAQ